MGLRVSGRGFDLGEALTGRIADRVDAALGKYFDGSHSGHVTVARDGTGYRADCVLHLGSGTTLASSGNAHDPYASFDQAAERIEKRLRRYKRRLKAHPTSDMGGNGFDGVAAAYAVLAAPEDEEDDEDGAPSATDVAHPPVIAESTRHLRRHGVSEAVAELDMTGAPVLVFVHAVSGRVNVVYRRTDGAIGWVDPQEGAGHHNPAPSRAQNAR
jgi:ribosomal subunit interface protein